MVKRTYFIILLMICAMFILSIACIGCSKPKSVAPLATSEHAVSISATPSPTSTTRPTPTTTPTIAPTLTPKPDYILFENEKIRISYLGIWPVEPGVSSDIMKFQVENFTNDYYVICAAPGYDFSGATRPDDGVIIVGGKEYRSCMYQFSVVDYKSSETISICALDRRNTLIQIPTNGTIDSVSLTLYFTGEKDSFDTGLLTVDLLNPRSARPEILDLDTQDFLGRPINAETIQAKRLSIVNYWATWCQYCVKEMPDLSRIAEEYATQGVGVIGVLINDDGNIEGAKEFVQNSSISYPNVVCEEVFAHLAYNQFALPVSMFFDQNGESVGSAVVGLRSYDEWRKIIDETLSKLP